MNEGIFFEILPLRGIDPFVRLAINSKIFIFNISIPYQFYNKEYIKYENLL